MKIKDNVFVMTLTKGFNHRTLVWRYLFISQNIAKPISVHIVWKSKGSTGLNILEQVYKCQWMHLYYQAFIHSDGGGTLTVPLKITLPRQIPCLCKLTWPIKPDSDSDSDNHFIQIVLTIFKICRQDIQRTKQQYLDFWINNTFKSFNFLSKTLTIITSLLI